MPVCRHCGSFYQAASDHDAVCPAGKVETPEASYRVGEAIRGVTTNVRLMTDIDDWEEGVDAAKEALPTRKDPSLWAVIRAYFREKLKRYRVVHRLPGVCAKWNREIGAKFAEDVAEQETYPDFDVDPMIVFKWNQLVWQEILMWNSLDEQVTQSDFLFICDRRGFSLAQRRYLEEMLEFMNLKGWTV